MTYIVEKIWTQIGISNCYREYCPCWLVLVE